ncbi:MAG: polyribonucleotide nucleotidyltransferase [Patiriisocius sp.]|jgi:polyribonucleotide nucleotidyltransferase
MINREINNMKPNVIKKTIDLGDGKAVTIETGALAKQADGSVIVKMGGTTLLGTVVSNKDVRDDMDFLPLTVVYKESFYATGKFPGGFFKREGRPSENEILTMRLVDRALRPTFPKDYHAETQVIIYLVSSDKENMPDALAGLAASAAIAVSDIPFNGPISEVRVARIDDKFVINPTYVELEKADIDMMVAGSAKSILMVEGEMAEISEEEMIEAIEAAHVAIKSQCKAQAELASEVAKSAVKREYCHEKHDDSVLKDIESKTYQKFYDVAKQGLGKEERGAQFKAISTELKEGLDQDMLSESGFMVGQYISKVKKKAIRNLLLDEGIRLDGRKTTDVRGIWSEIDYLPGTHGSAVFTRGETQSLTTLTLGSKLDEQKVDSALIEQSQRFMLHYNFPPFSTGEARPIRGTSRREIGHGNLALRAIKPMLPSYKDCPYTIRLVSEILESNGSSSMATVCAGTLALMDGGIALKRPVSGIAMGLIMDEETGKYSILSDILGDEDHLGDMDFKITGTTKGITACQMDIKVKGLSSELLKEALLQAKAGRSHILDEMMKTISEPKTDYKDHAPRIHSMEIAKDMIGAIIGPGGKIIQEIQEVTGTTIVIEEVNGKGVVDIISSDKDAMNAAIKKVTDIACPATVDIGEIYEGKVKSIMPYGAFVEVVPGKDGLLHISEITHERLNKVEEVLKEGDLVKFKVLDIDERSGKLKLSRKVLLEKPVAE